MALQRLSGWFRQFERPDEGQLIAGVCVGLSYRFEVDVTLVRLAFLLFALASGLGLVLYLLLWLLVPRAGSRLPSGAGQLDVVRDNLRGVEGDLRRTGQLLRGAWAAEDRHHWPRPLTRRWIALILIFGGAAVVLQSLGLFAWLGPTRAMGLAAVAFGIAMLLTHKWRR